MMNLDRMPDPHSTGLRRWLEAHLALLLFTLLVLLVAIWAVTLNYINAERVIAQRASAAALAGLLDTYQAQVTQALASGAAQPPGSPQGLLVFPLSLVVAQAEDRQLAAFERYRNGLLWNASAASALLLLSAAWLWTRSREGAKARRTVRLAQQTYAATSGVNLDAFFVLHSVRDRAGMVVDFRIAAANGQAGRMAGMTPSELCRHTLCDLLPDSRSNGLFDHLVHVSLVGGVHQHEWENEMPQFSAKWLHRQLVGVENGVVAIVRDISERKLVEARMQRVVTHDTLTGLPNRSLTGERLEQAITQAEKRQGGVLVAFIDLDSFKIINDGLGHHAGDQLLKVVAGRMRKILRRRDTLGRFGGDEFVLVAPFHPGRISTVAPLLDQIRAAAIAPIVLDGQEVQVGCSIGVALYPDDGDDPSSLLRNADVAMYHAKLAGRNNCQFYSQAMHAGAEEKLLLLEGLRSALEDGQLRVLYQPKVDLNTGMIIGVEALVRWHHPQQGVISPVRFIPLAEEGGMIISIGEWVLRTACRQSRAWQLAGLAPITMSVNVSPRQFEDKRLVARVAQALRESGLAPEDLELEVTESLIMRDLQQAVDKMAELKAMGLSLSIDDFGTGYSSLSTLKSFPISRLKIDQSFVRDLANSPDDQAIARAIIALSHQLQLRVIAEGVETEQQRQFLRENGCNEMQGYLFSQPVPAGQIQAMLERQAQFYAEGAVNEVALASE